MSQHQCSHFNSTLLPRVRRSLLACLLMFALLSPPAAAAPTALSTERPSESSSAANASTAVKDVAPPAGLPEGTNADWWKSVQAYVERDLRVIQPSAGDAGVAFRAQNSAQGLTFAFLSAGGFSARALVPMLHLDKGPVGEEPPAAVEPVWEWGLRPVAVGTSAQMVPLGIRRTSKAYLETLSNGYDVAWVLPGSQGSGLVEWFANAKGGLHQGFTLAARPAGTRDEQLVLRLSQSGNLRAETNANGHALAVVDADGRAVLKYARLHVFDAKGKALPAHFALHGDNVDIVVTDVGAVYPMTVDPIAGTATSPAWSTAGEETFNRFGDSVSGAGDVNGDGYGDIVVGASYYGNDIAGKVYVFHGGASGITGTAASPAWSAVGEGLGGYLGSSVAAAGDVNGDGYDDIVVGAWGVDSWTGKAYVFHGSAAGITGTATGPAWSAAGTAASDLFGFKVEGAGDVNGDGYADIVVGANGTNSNTGKVYVFQGSASGISGTVASPAWSIEGEASGNDFGRSVAAAGDVNGDGYCDIVVGAPYANSVTGKVYVFHGSAAGITGTAASLAWSAEGESGAGGAFGLPASGAGDVNGDGYSDIVVGANKMNSNTGKVYVFYGSLSGVSGTAASPAWSADGAAADDYFGQSLSAAGDVNGDGYGDLVVGATGAGGTLGKAYVFQGSGGGVSGTEASPAWSAAGEAAGDAFGGNVAAAGDVNGDGYGDIVVGAAIFNGQTGKVYVLHGGASGVSGTAASPAWSGAGEGTDNRFGFAVAGAGDVNGDGLGDIVVGANSPNTYSGKVYVFHGSVSGISGTAASPAWSAVGETANDWFGGSVSGAGDVNGDGFGDIAVGAPGRNSNKGKVYVFQGSASGVTGTAASPAWSAAGEEHDNAFGGSVAGAGDVNGDGYGDIVVGAQSAGGTLGKAYVFRGSASGLTGTTASPAWSAVGEHALDGFGVAVSGAGDVNGDGYGDIVVGASGVSGQTGKVYVFHGSASGITGATVGPAWSAVGETASNNLGSSVSGVGDVNGDGYGDIAVGASGANSSTGKVYVFRGSASGVTGTAASPAWSAAGEGAGDYFGLAIAGAGDVNGDGYGDIIVGAPGVSSHSGKAYVFRGSASGVSGTAASPAWSAVGVTAGDGFGGSLSSAWDVNGDGYGDIVVGASGTNSATGKVYVFHGGGSGRPVLARQLRSDGSTPVQMWGRTDSEGIVHVRMNATSAWGRQRAKLQVEACPAGIAYGGASCIIRTAAAWQDLTAATAGVALNLDVDGLANKTLYHWRARVLYAPMRVTAAVITAHPHPAYGPWRLLNAQASPANVRSISMRTLSVTITGIGTVASPRVGIDCGTSCSAPIEYGTQVTLTATAGEGYSFSNWGESCSGRGKCVLTMDANKSVSANFPPHGPRAHTGMVATPPNSPAVIDVVTKAEKGVDPNLAVVSVTQPVTGGVAAVEDNKVRFVPAPGFTGTADFRYTIQDGAQLTSSASIWVAVVETGSVVSEPQSVQIDDLTVDNTVTFTNTGTGTVMGTVTVKIPGGAIPYFDVTACLLTYLEAPTPEDWWIDFDPQDNFLVAQDAWYFSGSPMPVDQDFGIGASTYTGSQVQDPYAFNIPIQLSIEYDPARMIDTSKAVLFLRDNTASPWSDEGLTVLGVDTVNHTITFSVPRLGEFAFGMRLPTKQYVYLPAVRKP